MRVPLKKTLTALVGHFLCVCITMNVWLTEQMLLVWPAGRASDVAHIHQLQVFLHPILSILTAIVENHNA